MYVTFLSETDRKIGTMNTAGILRIVALASSELEKLRQKVDVETLTGICYGKSRICLPMFKDGKHVDDLYMICHNTKTAKLLENTFPHAFVKPGSLDNTPLANTGIKTASGFYCVPISQMKSFIDYMFDLKVDGESAIAFIKKVRNSNSEFLQSKS